MACPGGHPASSRASESTASRALSGRWYAFRIDTAEGEDAESRHAPVLGLEPLRRIDCGIRLTPLDGGHITE